MVHGVVLVVVLVALVVVDQFFFFGVVGVGEVLSVEGGEYVEAGGCLLRFGCFPSALLSVASLNR